MHTTKINPTTASRLISGLQQIPLHWALTPVTDNKRPYRENWQRETALTQQALIQELQSGKAFGYGIRTGEVSGGILAIDADGHAAEALLQKLSDGDLPDTVIFSSGKAGRRQLLYFVTEEYWQLIKTVKLKTGVKDDDGKEQLLEFRWNGLQSVLPPSVHPQTGSYHWVRSPQDIEVAKCPNWVISLMLNHQQPTKAPAPTPKPQTPTVIGRPPLEIFLGKDDRALIEHGTGDGGRNMAAQKLSLNLIATSRRLHELGIDHLDLPRVLYDVFCDRCTPPLSSQEREGWWRKADAIAKGPSLDDQKLQGCYAAWMKKYQNHISTTSDLSRKSIVYVDNGLLSTPLSTPNVDDESMIQAIVGNVYTIIESNYSEFFERQKLNSLYHQYKDRVDRKLFESIVSSQRVKVNEVLPEDEIRLKSLMDYSQTRINWDEVLPAPLARDIKHDAEKLNIDPVMIWQALLPAVSSLAGTFTLDEYGGIPAINWTCTVMPSGGGKTRADSLVFGPLRKMQLRADADYKEKAKDYKRAIVQYEKAGDFEAQEPEKPGLRKYLFEVATIQSVLKRLSEQGNHGSLWARDEFKGLFSSLNQFSGSETEATELVLKLWDNKPTFVDRADIENSYSIAGTAVSLAGGIQNDVFRKVFKDANDGNGMQARFLFAVPEQRKKKYVPGAYCRLKDRLPVLYEWLDNLTEQTVQIAPDAQKYFAKIVDSIGDQIEQISHAGIRTWMNKLDTHILRIALALHLIECFYSPSTTDIKTLSLATLKRAVTFAQYYRSAFHILQEKISTSDDIASIMLQIHAAALSKHPDGISARDVYKDSRPIQNRAKAALREAGAYVADLFEKMAQMGYGSVVRKGRSVRFIAFQKPNFEKGFNDVDNVDNSPECYQETCYSEDKDCLHDRRQSGIVYVDNQNNTEALTDIQCQELQSNFTEALTEVECQESQSNSPVDLIGKTVTITAGGRFDGMSGEVIAFDGEQCRVIADGRELWFAPEYLSVT
ncbi:DUF3987 domain-containing protein [Nodularia chucula]|uniref:DUF3987 domain-containing protein n=1 Tax=Nodularia chucula TaxID=3093667 RepID=UPI0039C7507F